MQRRFALFTASTLAVFLTAGTAHAASLKGKDLSTVPDILRHARGLTGKEVSLELRKDSLLRLHDDGQLDLRYNIGNGDKDLSLGQIKDYAYKAGLAQNKQDDGFHTYAYFTQTYMLDDGFSAILTETKLGGKKLLITTSRHLSLGKSESVNTEEYVKYYRPCIYTNWCYDVYFATVSKSDDGKISQSRFGAWRYPNKRDSKDSGYIKDIDTGIFVNGFDGELVVAATMTATNDHRDSAVDYSTKTVGARFDFWALFTDDSGNVQYKKLDNLTQTKSGFTTAALSGIKNAPDAQWDSTNNLSSTAASPYMVIKTATGDFNHDGFANEVAVLATDNNGIYMWMYQLEYKDGTFSIQTMKDKVTIFNYRYPGYFSSWSYNGWNRTPGADILAGDFDGDGETEIAVIFQGDFPSGERNAMMFGGTVKTLHTNLYKWDNQTGDLKATPYEVNDYETTMDRPFKQISYSGMYHNQYRTIGYRRHLITSWGGFKATVLDIDGDGKDEIAFAGYRSDMYYHVKANDSFTDRSNDTRGDKHAEYRVRPYLSLVKMDTDGKLKSSRIFEGDPIIDKRYTSYNGQYENNLDNWNAFQLQECNLAPVDTNAELYPFADRELSIAAGAFFGKIGLAKECDDLALRLSSGKMILFKSDGSTLTKAQTLDAAGTSALVAGDFASEGIELGKPTFTTRTRDKSYMAVIQAPPYHVDTISADGKTVTTQPVNFSFTKGAHVSYGKSDQKSKTQMSKFDMHSSVETIFAMDSDMTRNVIGGARTAQKVYGAIKNIASIIPGTSHFENAVKKAKAVDGAASAVFNFLDKITDKVETIKQGYNKEIESSEVFETITAQDADTFGYVQADQYIWRYPIVTKPAPNLGTMSDDAKYLTKQDFITFTIYGEVRHATDISSSEYQPTHENGNLFSYPTAIANIEGYAHKQKELSDIESIQFGAQVQGGQSFSKVKENETTESKKVSTGYLTDGLSLVDSIFGTDLAKVPEGEKGPTYTRYESSSERIDWELPRNAAAPLDTGYRTHYQAYVAENGAITCGFAVSDFNTRLNLFSSEGIYSKYADPAFPLPNKFKCFDSKPDLPVFTYNTSRSHAMEMRGVRIYAIDFNRYTSSRLLKGARYRVEVPMYNASFKPVESVRVDLYWVNDDTVESLSGKQLIGTQYVSIPAWSNLGDNKTWAKFEFTPNIPVKKRYQFYALIDPEGKLPEVHENRDEKKDPGGNNEGYFEFTVEDVESAKATAAFYAGDFSAAGFKASLSEEDVVFPTMTFGGYSTWDEFYNAKIANTDGPVEMEVTITNHMDLTIPRVEIIAVYLDPELWADKQEIGCAHFARNITLFPYETYRYTFTIGDNVADDLRRVGAINTVCSYTPRSLFELLYGTEDSPGLIGDADPELEVASGDVSADVEPDETRYYDSVITETYALSHDVPVFWRINGIADVISDTDTEDVYVKDSAALPATPEEFSLVWSPSDAGTVKTAATELTVSTIPGVTRAGQYALTVQVSEDGETWTDKDALMFGTADSGSTNGLSSSSSGCDWGYSPLALMVLAVMIRRKTR
ncbi:MAG: hypothetical protein II832_10605 [Synergistaceae bacterium]|nr:hypothetical protein [Synergistaceae bacterium]